MLENCYKLKKEKYEKWKIVKWKMCTAAVKV